MFFGKTFTFVISIFFCGASAALAGVCDYRLSKKIGGISTSAIAGASGVAGGAGGTAAAAGIYAFPHATAGAMLGSTAAGTSAAGTTGIIAGSGGVVGTVGGVAVQPWFWIPAAVIAASVGGFEGACYLLDD